MELEKYINLFIEESKENLIALNSHLLNLEKGSGDLNLLNDIFRVAHTLKGMAATMGFDEITNLTHEMESLLDLLRNEQLVINPEIIDILFLCLDSLELLVENISSNDKNPVDVTNLIDRLKKQISLDPNKLEILELKNINNDNIRDKYFTEYSNEETSNILEALKNNYQATEIEVVLMKDSAMKSIRVFLIFQALEAKTKIIKSTPTRDNLDNEKFGQNFVITIIHTEDIEEIKDLVLAIGEVEQVYTEDLAIKFKDQLNNKKVIKEDKSNSNFNLKYNQTEKNVLLEAIIQDFKCYEIYVSLMANTVMKSVRVSMVFNAIQDLGCQIIKSVPSHSEISSTSEDNFIITVISDKDESVIRDVILKISEINQAEILIIAKPYLEDNTKTPFTSNGNKVPELTDYQKLLILEANNFEKRALLIGIHLMSGTVMKYARYILVSKKLESVGEIIKTIPDHEEIEAEHFEDYFQVLLITGANNIEIMNLVSSVAEIENIVDLDSLITDESKDITLLPNQQTQESNNIHYIKPKILKSENEPVLVTQTDLNKTNLIEDNKSTVIEDDLKSEKLSITNKKNITKKSTIRVDMDRLDELINLVEELTIIKNRLSKIGSNINSPELIQSVRNLSLISGNLQNNAMHLRMVAVENIFNRFPRMIRDIAKNLNKEINFIMEGEETELDRTIIDEIGDPLVHLLRNSADHGIETYEERIKSGKTKIGTIKLIARHEGNNVLIMVEDDGGGINTQRVKKKAIEKNIITHHQAELMTEEEALKIIFLPGFSTIDVATNLSGRGVGMDAVIFKVQSIGGTVNVSSEIGIGSRFTIKLPLTLAIMEVLLVEIGDEIYAIPITYIEEVRELLPEEIKNINKVKVTIIRDKTIALVDMGNLLKVKRLKPKEIEDPDIYTNTIRTIIVRTEEGKKISGLIVDKIIGQEDVVIKPLGRIASDRKNYISGTANLGDGNLALILNIPSIRMDN